MLVEHFAGEVVDQVAVVAGEGVDELARVGASSERQPREVETGCPALRAFLKLLDIGLFELQPEPGEHLVGLLHVEAQLASAYVHQFAACAQACEAERRIHA